MWQRPAAAVFPTVPETVLNVEPVIEVGFKVRKLQLFVVAASVTLSVKLCPRASILTDWTALPGKTTCVAGPDAIAMLAEVSTGGVGVKVGVAVLVGVGVA